MRKWRSKTSAFASGPTLARAPVSDLILLSAFGPGLAHAPDLAPAFAPALALAPAFGCAHVFSKCCASAAAALSHLVHVYLLCLSSAPKYEAESHVGILASPVYCYKLPLCLM